MSLIIRSLLPALILLSSSINLSAQVQIDTLSWEIETLDGNSFIGKLIEQDKDKILLETEIYGRINIPRKSIKDMVQIQPEEMVGDEYFFKNPHASRYFFAPNGYGLEKRKGYYENTWILFNQVSYGFNDYFTVGAGVMPLFLFGGTPTPVWITPKVQFPLVKDKWNIGTGILLAAIVPEEGVAGIPYFVNTFGSRDHNLTIGIGYGFTGDGWAEMPIFNLSGITRLSKKTFFMTENYYLNIDGQSVGLISLGGRTVQKRLAVSYGLVIPIADLGFFLAIPWLGINIPF